MSRKNNSERTPSKPGPSDNKPSLKSAVEHYRSWIERQHRTSGWEAIAQMFRDAGYSRATGKNVRQPASSK